MLIIAPGDDSYDVNRNVEVKTKVTFGVLIGFPKTTWLLNSCNQDVLHVNRKNVHRLNSFIYIVSMCSCQMIIDVEMVLSTDSFLEKNFQSNEG